MIGIRQFSGGQRRLLLLMALPALLTSCASTGPRADEASGAGPDEASIVQLVRQMEHSLRNGDAKNYVSLWTMAGSSLLPFGRQVQGKDQLLALAEHSVAGRRCECRLVLLELDVHGDWAFARIDFAGELFPPDADVSFDFDDTLLLVLKRTGGYEWRIHVHFLVYDERVHVVREPRFALPDGVDLRRGIIYASPGGYDLRLDLFSPRGRASPVPAVVFVHGGSWFGGHPRDLWRQAADLAGRGFAVATIEYRVSGERRFPSAVEDAKAAVRWMRAHAQELGIIEDKIGIMGNSAGAQIAGMVGTTNGLPELEGAGGHAGYSSSVQAVAVIDPPLDLTEFGRRYPDPPIAHRALGFQLGASHAEDPTLWSYASPITHIDEHTPPFLIMHGSLDPLTPPVQSLDMYRKLLDVGVQAELFTAEGGSHDFFQDPEWYDRVVKRIESFFRHTLVDGSDR